jgi:hypothetical protein
LMYTGEFFFAILKSYLFYYCEARLPADRILNNWTPTPTAPFHITTGQYTIHPA